MVRYIVLWNVAKGDSLSVEAAGVDDALSALFLQEEHGGIVIAAADVEEVIQKIREAANR